MVAALPHIRYASLALVWVLSVTCMAVSQHQDQQQQLEPPLSSPASSPPAVLGSNPLRGLPPLALPHFSWPFPSSPTTDYLRNSSKLYLGGFLHDYVRITGSCPLCLG